MTASPHRVCIIGGGITGLAAAWELHQLNCTGDRPVSFTLYEAGSRTGGKVGTLHDDGFILEQGPDSFITQKPDALTLCRELGLKDDLIACNTDNQRVYIARNNTLYPLPQGFRLLAPTNIASFLASPLFSPWGKLRALCEPLIPKRASTDDESIADFVRRRLGPEILERAAGPILAGIYNGDPEDLGIQTTFPMLPQLEQKHGSLVRGFRRIKAKAGTKPPPMFMSLRGGMSALTDALQDNLSDSIKLNTPVHSLHRDGTDWVVETEAGREGYDAVIVTTSPAIAARLLPGLSADTAAPLTAMKTTSLVAVSFGFKQSQRTRPDALDGFGFVTSLSPDRMLTACTWSSTKFDNRAPADSELVRLFLSVDEADAAKPDTDWEETARSLLAPYITWEGQPVISKVTRWPASNPQYPVNHSHHVAAIRDSLSSLPGLIVAGSSWDGVGLPDCIRQGRDAARAAVQT